MAEHHVTVSSAPIGYVVSLTGPDMVRPDEDFTLNCDVEINDCAAERHEAHVSSKRIDLSLILVY